MRKNSCLGGRAFLARPANNRGREADPRRYPGFRDGSPGRRSSRVCLLADLEKEIRALGKRCVSHFPLVPVDRLKEGECETAFDSNRCTGCGLANREYLRTEHQYIGKLP